MKHFGFNFPDPKRGVKEFHVIVEAKDESDAVGKLNAYLAHMRRHFFRPPKMLGGVDDPWQVAQECIGRLKAIEDPTAFVLTLHLFTEHWLNLIIRKFCPCKDLSNFRYRQKLDICFALGKLTEDLHFNLGMLNGSRNDIAHKLDFDFTKMPLGYRGCHPGFELQKYQPTFDREAEQHHISNILVGVMDVTFMKLQKHCVTSLGFKRPAASSSAESAQT